MIARRSTLPVLALGLLVAGLAACAARAPANLDALPAIGELVTAEEIAKTGATNAWDALRFTVKSHYFYEYKGQPVRVTANRGTGSIILREDPLIFLDRTRLADIFLLRQVPASEIHSIQVLSGADGTTYFGTSAAGGVIVIRTVEAQPRMREAPDTGAALTGLGIAATRR